jgi:hypothetical protein
MTADPHHDPELWAKRRERAIRWMHTDLHGEDGGVSARTAQRKD